MVRALAYVRRIRAAREAISTERKKTTMRSATATLLGGIMLALAVCQAHASTVDASRWRQARPDTAARPPGLSPAQAASARAVQAAARSPHVYDALERMVDSGRVVSLRHTMTAADLWLARAPEPSCVAAGGSRRGKCAS